MRSLVCVYVCLSVDSDTASIRAQAQARRVAAEQASAAKAEDDLKRQADSATKIQAQARRKAAEKRVAELKRSADQGPTPSVASVSEVNMGDDLVDVRCVCVYVYMWMYMCISGVCVCTCVCPVCVYLCMSSVCTCVCGLRNSVPSVPSTLFFRIAWTKSVRKEDWRSCKRGTQAT